MTRRYKTNIITLLIPVLTIVFLVSVQAWHFHDLPYRQDEAWVVHYAIENIARVGFVNHALQIFSTVVPENLIQDTWIMAFGHDEHIVRFLSTLTTTLTLAMFYRFAADLFDKQTGRIALFLLGTLSIFVFYTHEARPYAALAFGAVGFQWALLRFIHHPNRTYALLALALGVIPFYQHPFLLYVYGAQVISILIFVRWDRKLYMQGIGLFVILTALVGLRIYLNFAARGGEIDYATLTSIDGLLNLYESFKFNPEFLGLFLLTAGFVIPITTLNLKASTKQPFRFGNHWRQGWMIANFVLMMLLIMTVNQLSPNVTPRNMLIVAPLFALIAAYALRHVPWQGQIIAILIFCVPFVNEFRVHNSNAGYWELRDYMSENYDTNDGRILVAAPAIWQWIPIKYYLDEQTDLGLTDEDILYITQQPTDKFAPYSLPPSHAIRSTIPADLEQLETYLGERDSLWLIMGGTYPGSDAVVSWIDEHYTIYDRIDFPGEGYYRALEVIEYRRQPDNLDTLVRFGEDIRLENWHLNDAVIVQPCQTISVDTWWQTDITEDTLYNSTLVIADENGQGIANADANPGGIFLTSIWEPDTLYFDERHLTVPCDTPSGEYLLLLGLYNVETIENLGVNAPDGSPMGTNLLYLTTLTVE